MDKALAQWFLDEVSQKMAFLVEEHSFGPPSCKSMTPSTPRTSSTWAGI